MVLDKFVLEILFGLKLGKQLTGSCTGSQESISGLKSSNRGSSSGGLLYQPLNTLSVGGKSWQSQRFLLQPQKFFPAHLYCQHWLINILSLPINHVRVALSSELEQWNMVQTGLVISMITVTTKQQNSVNSFRACHCVIVSQHSKQQHFRVGPISIL